MIQLNRLEGFYWVAKTGGYAKAARAFPYPITQPAVHQQVKKLETEVGVALFERVGKESILLTPAGRQLYAFVEPFFGDLATLLRALRAGTPEGELKVHAQSLFLRELLPAWLRRIQKRSPGVRIDLHELGDDPHAPLRSGLADLVVTYIPDETSGIERRTVATLHPFLVLPNRHPLAARKRPRVAELVDETLVAYAHGTIAQRLQLEELARHGIHPSRIVTATTADTILSLVEAGMGYSLVPWLSVDGPRRRGIVARPLPGKRHHYPVHAAWRKSSAANPLLKAALAAAPQP